MKMSENVVVLKTSRMKVKPSHVKLTITSSSIQLVSTTWGVCRVECLKPCIFLSKIVNIDVYLQKKWIT